MEELCAISNNIELMLADMVDVDLTGDEFQAQLRGFIVGNAFDIYHDANTVTDQSVVATERLRLRRTR
jgi:hypothetical protein